MCWVSLTNSILQQKCVFQMGGFALRPSLWRLVSAFESIDFGLVEWTFIQFMVVVFLPTIKSIRKIYLWPSLFTSLGTLKSINDTGPKKNDSVVWITASPTTNNNKQQTILWLHIQQVYDGLTLKFLLSYHLSWINIFLVNRRPVKFTASPSVTS